jgi:3-isopropylmalate/(R)-2-methylmalate dehydratase small subunit
MQAFKKFTGIMAYLPIPNIDTDMIIPKQYLKTIKRTGLGKYLFAEMRYDDSNQEKPDFILNQPVYQNAKVLLTEENFGCGSSREHAVWSLLDFGIKVIIAPSFADIFYSNCFKNGLLPIIVSNEQIHALATKIPEPITIDLDEQWIYMDSISIHFSLDVYRREILLKGLDEIGETLLFASKIKAFEEKQKTEQPWLYSGENNDA